jgi:hypothetical protein
LTAVKTTSKKNASNLIAKVGNFRIAVQVIGGFFTQPRFDFTASAHQIERRRTVPGKTKQNKNNIKEKCTSSKYCILTTALETTARRLSTEHRDFLPSPGFLRICTACRRLCGADAIHCR